MSLQKQASAAGQMVSVIAADMDLHMLERKVTAKKDKAFQAWVETRHHVGVVQEALLQGGLGDSRSQMRRFLQVAGACLGTYTWR